MKVFVLDGPFRKCLGTLPESVELVAEPQADVELLILDQELRPRLSELLFKMPRLRVIQSTQAGVELVLPQVPKGIIVCSATGAHDIAVAEWVVMALLAVQRRLPTFLERQERAEWDREVDGPIRDL
ncbi:MAG: D-isomer specific 2-hydroxyacid dehydrogenase NAD-binding protein, partial [Labilithrix sp.]|nr:D-isomer specific 2-hydroxyacid dehydrogenase NAD-binding protein [Labilithrix sp.]